MVRLSVLLLLVLGFTSASSFWICPSSLPFPVQSDISFENKGGCQEIEIEEGFFPFLFEDAPHLVFPRTGKLRIISLERFAGYSVALCHDTFVEDLDMVLLGTSRQIISLNFQTQAPEASLSAPSFQKAADKDDIVNKLSGEEYYSEMEKITGEKPLTVNGQQHTVKTRYTYTSSNLVAAEYFKERFENLGYNTFFQPFTFSGRSAQNIIAVKNGTSSEIVVVGAHYDSTSNDPNNLAPGCIDNGSGTESVMSLAKALMGYNNKRTIHFVLFGAEEQGLIGSNYYVNNLRNNGYDVKYSLVMDMIGYSNRYFGVKLETSSSNANKVLADLMEENLKVYSPTLTRTRTTNYFGSDHVPFINAGIPCFLAIEQDDTNYVGYHRTTDRVNYLSVDQSIAISRGMVATLYDLAF